MFPGAGGRCSTVELASCRPGRTTLPTRTLKQANLILEIRRISWSPKPKTHVGKGCRMRARPWTTNRLFGWLGCVSDVAFAGELCRPLGDRHQHGREDRPGPEFGSRRIKAKIRSHKNATKHGVSSTRRSVVDPSRHGAMAGLRQLFGQKVGQLRKGFAVTDFGHRSRHVRRVLRTNRSQAFEHAIGVLTGGRLFDARQ